RAMAPAFTAEPSAAKYQMSVRNPRPNAAAAPRVPRASPSAMAAPYPIRRQARTGALARGGANGEACGRMTAAMRLGLALTILILALGAVALAVDRWAPPQHLPWKPLTLDQPIGLATHWKIARLAAGPPDACRAVLAAGGVRFRPAANVIRTGFCTTEGAGRVAAGLPGLNPPGAAMTCGETLALAVWLRRSVEPAAREAFHAEVGGLDHFGTYACRAVRGG